MCCLILFPLFARVDYGDYDCDTEYYPRAADRCHQRSKLDVSKSHLKEKFTENLTSLQNVFPRFKECPTEIFRRCVLEQRAGTFLSRCRPFSELGTWNVI